MNKTLTLDEIASRFPEHAIEVSRSGDTGQPPHKWRASWYRRYGCGYPAQHVGDTQDEALRLMLSSELDKAKESVDCARHALAFAEAHLRDQEAVITELLRMESPDP